MDLTTLLVQIIGAYFLLAGISIVLYPKRFSGAMKEASKSYILPYFDGALALIAGLLIVLNHNLWDTLPQGIVSAVGWLALLEGFAMFLLPQESFAAFMRKFDTHSWRMGMGIVSIVIGAYLAYIGFLT